MATYIFPQNKAVGKSQTFSLYETDIVSFNFNDNNFYIYNGTVFASGAFTESPLVSGATASTTNSGYPYWTSWDNQVGYITSGKAIVSYAAPSGTFFNGAATASQSYFGSWGGSVYTVSGASLVSGTYFVSGAVGLSTDSSNLYSVIAPENQLGVYNIVSGTASYSQPPITNLLQIINQSASSADVGVIGTAETALRAYGAYNIIASPNGDYAVFSNPVNNTLYLLTGPDPSWQVINSLAASGTAKWGAWSSTNTQVLFIDSNIMEVYDVANSALSPAQSITLSASGATQIVSAPLVDFALISNPSANIVEILGYSTGTWLSSGSVSLTAPTALFPVSSTKVGVTVSGGYTFLNYTSNAWVAETVSTLSYTPNSIFEDANGLIYLCGNSGTTANITVVSGANTYSATYTGDASQIYVQQNQILVLDSTNSKIRIYFLLSGALSLQATIALPAAWTGVFSTGISLFGVTNTSIYQYYLNKPFSISPIPYGVVSLYSGGGWSNTKYMTVAFEIPMASVWKSDGTFWFATTKNNLYELNGTTLTSSVITDYQAQATSQPIGVSDLLWYSDGHLYATTSMNSALLQLL